RADFRRAVGFLAGDEIDAVALLEPMEKLPRFSHRSIMHSQPEQWQSPRYRDGLRWCARLGQPRGQISDGRKSNSNSDDGYNPRAISTLTACSVQTTCFLTETSRNSDPAALAIDKIAVRPLPGK
ncbi:MAG: hypothetical protein MUF04_10885, partial [Akkermansiaceae bacterium]|nr:hypothetical protein [Akkermansiaceae bacterium]